MKALLICPGERLELAALAETAPLSTVPMLGQAPVAYWLEHLSARGAKEVIILASDRPEQVRAIVGDGARWGLRVEVVPEAHELTVDEARARFCRARADWLAAPDDVSLIDHLPGMSDVPLFGSYAGWFQALLSWMPRAATPVRIGAHEIQPGVWAGLRTRVSPQAELRAPCWLGDDVRIGKDCVIGPMAVVEARSWIEPGVEVSGSVIGPETFVGKFTEVHHSIAWEGTLINWKLNSAVKVPGSFLLCSLRGGHFCTSPGLPGRSLALLAMLLSWPACLPALWRAWRRGLPFVERCSAVRPTGVRPETIWYYELNGAGPCLRRWPQLASIARGDFTWVGNRPLDRRRAARLRGDFERLWLKAPIGLISLADAEGCLDPDAAEALAHSSFYAARADHRLNRSIFLRGMRRLLFGGWGTSPAGEPEECLLPLQVKRGETN